jgi:hypothetical protein
MANSTVERAFELAPECSTIEELQTKLVREGWTNVEAHLKDSLRRELRRLLRSNK